MAQATLKLFVRKQGSAFPVTKLFDQKTPIHKTFQFWN